MPRYLVRPLVLACTVLLLAACSSLGPKLTAPTVDVVSVQMLSTDMFAQKFRVRLKLQNPNDLELKVASLQYQIMLMGDPFAEGASVEQFLVPAKGEAEFDMNVTTDFVSSLGRLISRMGGGRLENIDYEITGTVTVDKGIVHNYKIPFDHKGKVNFVKAPKKPAE